MTSLNSETLYPHSSLHPLWDEGFPASNAFFFFLTGISLMSYHTPNSLVEFASPRSSPNTVTLTSFPPKDLEPGKVLIYSPNLQI